MHAATSSWRTILNLNRACSIRILKMKAVLLCGDLAIANGQLVATLNQTKVSLLTRLRGDRGQRGTRRTLQYYFVAQDIHERASSSHIQYQTLRDRFRYSDVMFRFQRMLSMQAQACQKLSRAILLREPYLHDTHFERAFMHLDAALDRVKPAARRQNRLRR